MKNAALILCLALTCLAPTLSQADNLDKDFDQALCKYFQVTSDEVDGVRASGLETEEIPVCFYIADRCGAKSESIASMRARGDSWSEIVMGRNQGMNIFYKPITGYSVSETYYPILSKFDAVPSSDWRKLELSDEDIVNLVNLRFISSQHDYSIYKVMEQRDQGMAFLEINQKIKDAKHLLVVQQERERRGVVNAGF